MNDEKLTQLNELSSKIKGKKAVLKKIDELSEKSGVVITRIQQWERKNARRT